ncbi:hypothetical protein D0A37_23605 [Microcoleus vaginatus HSN003]|nr:hypothetical protein D0A37_23605 [Microcoleus vaginatus HSN003]
MAASDRTPQKTLADRVITARSACFFVKKLYQVRSIDYPPLGRRGLRGSITYTTTTDFGEPADASWRCGDFTRHDITLNPLS